MLGRLGKDVYSAQHRIFDHRAFVTGEINHFLENFELKRNETEVQALFKVTEIVGELKYEQCNRCSILAQAHLADISSEVNNLSVGIAKFLDAAKIVKPLSAAIVQARQKREERRSNFQKDLDHQYERVASSFEQKEEEIVELYADLQLKLSIPK